VCGKESPLAAAPSTQHVKAATHASGELNTVSFGLVRQMAALSPDILSHLRGTKNITCKLVWSIPPFTFPKFTTSHALVGGDSTGVSFSGGLDWAIKISHRFNSSRSMPTRNSQGESESGSNFVPPDRGVEPSTGETLQGPGLPISISSVLLGEERPLAYPSQMPAHSGWRLFQDVGSPARGRTFQPSEHENACADDAEQPNSPASLTTATTRHTTPDLDHETAFHSDWAPSRVPGQSNHLDMLSRRRQEAERLYAETEDASSIFSLLDSAVQDNEAWHPSGLPRF